MIKPKIYKPTIEKTLWMGGEAILGGHGQNDSKI